MRLLSLLAGFALLAAAQGQKGPPNLDRLSSNMKDYLRGVTESRFDVQSKITLFDATGKLKKVSNETHGLEFTQGSFRGTESSADMNWASTIHITRASRGTVGLQTFTDLDGLVTPAMAFANKKWALKVSASPEGSVTVAYGPTEKCATFESAGNEFKYSAALCGTGQIALDADGAVPMRMTFEAVGLPIKVGKRALTSYRVAAEFQTETVAGGRQSVTLPKSATATFSLSDRRIVVENRYTLHPGK